MRDLIEEINDIVYGRYEEACKEKEEEDPKDKDDEDDGEDGKEGDGKGEKGDDKEEHVENPLDSIRKLIDGHVTEGKSKYDATTLLKIKKLVDKNAHGEALELAAGMLGSRYFEKKFGLINKLHDMDGHLDGDLKKYRLSASYDLDKLAKKELSDEEYDEFNSMF
jgi:hypothetical protein